MIRVFHRSLIAIAVGLLGLQGLRGAAPAFSVAEGKDQIGRWYELRLGSATMRLRDAPAGTFWMGSPEKEVGRHADELRHRVTLSRAFAIGQHEVTQAQWKAAMGGLPRIYSGTVKGPPSGPDDEVDNNERATKVVQPKDLISTKGDVPIVFVSWDDCQAFCKRVNAGLSGWRVRLPTEAEWEYACRAGTDSAYNDGSSVKSARAEDRNLNSLAWYQEGGDRTLRPVGGRKPNAWGLYDMHGNACEWCQDYYGPYEARDQADPRGPDKGKFRVIRGGSYDLNAEDCRSAWRMWREAGEQHKAIGLRLVLERINP
ncbi:MAG: formylglycine-generating enzyme family protein [Planctomycetia bacterium]|nr:formylglycine-generating enzyme family protein [Planctomycetia bacterium]